MMIKAILWIVSLFVVVGCQTFDNSTPQVRRDVKDVNIESANGEISPRKRLVILPFLEEGVQRPASIREQARAAFIMDLNRSGEVIALDSDSLKLDLNQYREGNTYKMNELAKAAQQLGANAVLEGKILDIRIKRKSDNVGVVRHLTTAFEVVAQVRVVSGRTSQEVFNTIKTVTVEESGVRVGQRVDTDKYLTNNPEVVQVIVKDAFLDFAPQVVAALEKVVWEGRIAAISGDRYYLNVGRVSGVKVGDLLRVTEDGDDIYDPESGGHIGRVSGRLKGTLEIISYFGNDGAIAIIHSGAGFRENDRVELY